MKNNHMKHRRFLEGSTHYHCNALCGNAILKREKKQPSFARTVCFSNVPRFSEEGGFDLGESSAVEEERPDIDDTASFFTAAFRSRNCCFLRSARTSSASGSRIAKKKLDCSTALCAGVAVCHVRGALLIRKRQPGTSYGPMHWPTVGS